MRSVTVTVVLSVVVKELEADHIFNIQDKLDKKLVDKLEEELVARALKELRPDQEDLDNTVLGKPGHLSSTRTSLRSLPALHAFSTGTSASSWASHLPYFHGDAARHLKVRAEKEINWGRLAKVFQDKAKEAVDEFNKEVTGDPNYKAGDSTNVSAWTESAKKGLKEFNKEVTGKEDIKVDDIAKAWTANAKGGITEFGKEVTGNDNYQIDDTTKALAEGAQKRMSSQAWSEKAMEGITEISKEATNNKGLTGQVLKPCALSQGQFCTYIDQVGWSGKREVCVGAKKEWLQAKGLQPVENWCVSAWDYARALDVPEKAAGLGVVCDATNGDVRNLYSAHLNNPLLMKNGSPLWYQTKFALEKIEEQCGPAPQ